ncbi:MAG: TonB-dependent receptor plug domain-containing protein, partial [Mucilaginibacter polytrichastri]|nr:TonB-dependent receptor plug domain-containing protein [Mucilaginibacter polytrichastri]
MKKNLLFVFLALFITVGQVLAQQKTITGKVTSAEDNGPLPGVSIKVKGSANGVSTNSEGVYSIRASAGQVLVFSSIGFVTQEKTIGNEATINLQMGGDSKSLDEVVVTAYGIERSQKSLGYDAQSVKGADIAKTQRGNFINSLQGRVAGVTITPTNGTPGASSQIIIRGAVSLDGDNQPLFVVDGLPISNNTFSEYGLVGQGTFNRQNDYGNRAMDINPDEIESVTILKGPEASAIYGTQGASGAVVITTKRAKAGKAAITYNNSFRADRAYRFPDIQKVYGGGAGGIFDEEVRTRTYFGARWPSNRQFYDNLGAFYQTGWTQRHNAAIEGGSEALSVRTGIGFENQNGVIPGTDYRTINFKVTGTAKISDKISTNASVNMISSKTNKAYKGASSPMLSVLTWPIVDDIRNRYTETGDRRTITGMNNAELDNPIWAMENNPNSDQVSRILSNLGITYAPTDWLNFRGTFGADIYTMQGFSGYHPQAYLANVASSRYAGGGLNTFSEDKKLFNGSFVASAQKSFGKFRPAIRVGYDFNDDRDQITAQFGSRFYQT